MHTDRWQMLTHPADGSGYIDAFAEAVANRSSFHGEIRVKNRNGRWRWLESWGEPRFDSDGHYLGHAGASADITDRKRAERVLARDAAFTRRVLDNLFTFAGVLEIDGTVITANRAPLAAAGIELDDVVGQKFWDCWWWTYDAEVSRELERAAARAADGEVVRYDVAVRIVDHGRLTLDFQIAPLFDNDGDITHLVVSGLDLTEREQNKKELEQARWKAEILAAIAGLLSSAVTPEAVGSVALEALAPVGAAAIDLLDDGNRTPIAAIGTIDPDGANASVSIPCRSSRGDVIAVITCAESASGELDGSGNEFAQAVASLTAGALERALLHQRSERRRARAELTAGIMTAVESEGSVLTQLQRYATELVPAIGDFVLIESSNDERSLLAIATREPDETETFLEWWRRNRDRIRHDDPVATGELDGRVVHSVELGGTEATVYWGHDEAHRVRASDTESLAFMRDLSARVGLVIAASQAFERERAASLRLQRALLPERLATNPRIDIFSLYEAAADRLRVGGDWYDTFTWPDGSYGIVVGDVVGHDVEAAAAMGRIRSVSNVLISEGKPDPVEMLTILDRVVRSPQGTRFATALCAVLRPDVNRIDYASAGHPPAVLMRSGEPPRFLNDAQNPPLSAMKVDQRLLGSATIEADDLLVFYSDGLIERRGEHIGQGMERLADHLQDLGDLDVADVGASLVDGLISDRRDDDTVVVTVRFASTKPRLSLTVPAYSAELTRIRAEMRSWLETYEVSADRTVDVLLALGEAASNAIEHAYAGSTPESIHVRSSIRADTLHLTVQDHGRWLPIRIRHNHRGRGSRIMDGAADTFERRTQATGTTVHMTFDLS